MYKGIKHPTTMNTNQTTDDYIRGYLSEDVDSFRKTIYPNTEDFKKTLSNIEWDNFG